MPNFHAKEFVEPSYPSDYGKTNFEFVAQSTRGEKLVMSHLEDNDLLLKINKSKKGYLIKGDKITRPSQVAILQQVLKDYRDLTKTNTTNSNIDSKKEKTLKVSPFLKTMEYFANSFETSKDILVEVGFGSGRHLLHQAKKNPDKIVIGLEIHKPSIEQVLKQCELQNIENILVVDYDARTFLEFLNSNSVKQIFVHFPVPWDKKPHRRVISTAFINESRRVLMQKGTLELRTDSDNYFEYSFGEFIKQAKVELHVNKNQDLEISSKYEDRWKRQEKDIYDITMINKEISEDIPRIGTLKFDETIEFKKVKEKFQEVTLRGDDFFAHIEEIFKINKDEGLVRVSFGASQRNEHSYLYIKKDSVTYLPDNVLATKDNEKAHKLIKEHIWNM
ncbi:tRNA (guanosine(46)-N7)-methyltransferase TrmB [Sulfurospirillum arcachonense]|uniref:tRNA (guanosine(46)-N7)-methyltransferase TrmB n=1 Tax=Sulfurospirillum arcachonense TaxID=57666 RepID=UPI0004690153|nr:tRNA (guanosine(46)-N7)-methyltransferase TrmB [Sulfurospirillum arcachonense]